MAAPWHEQRPRDKQTVPVPTPMQRANSNKAAGKEETIKAVRPRQHQHHCYATSHVTSAVVMWASMAEVLPAVPACRACVLLLRHQLREKLSEFQAENNLLGTLVKELKVRVGVYAAAWKRVGEASSC